MIAIKDLRNVKGLKYLYVAELSVPSDTIVVKFPNIIAVTDHKWN